MNLSDRPNSCRSSVRPLKDIISFTHKIPDVRCLQSRVWGKECWSSPELVNDSMTSKCQQNANISWSFEEIWRSADMDLYSNWRLHEKTIKPLSTRMNNPKVCRDDREYVLAEGVHKSIQIQFASTCSLQIWGTIGWSQSDWKDSVGRIENERETFREEIVQGAKCETIWLERTNWSSWSHCCSFPRVREKISQDRKIW